MEQSIQSLNPRHYTIVELCLRGWTNKQIAEHLSMSQTQVSVVINSPSFQHELAIRRSKLADISNNAINDSIDEVTEEIKRGTKDAVRRLIRCIDSPDEGIAVRASAEILDRSGYGKVTKIESKNISINITAEDAKRIADTLLLDSD